MIGYDRLVEAWEPFEEAMGSTEFAAVMAGIEPEALAAFAKDVTKAVNESWPEMSRDYFASGMLACGIIAGIGLCRQEAQRG